MKTTNMLTALFAVAILLGSCNSKELPGDWKLVWEDDFNGKTLDTAQWSKIPRGKSDWNRHMSDYDALYAVRDGNLVLRGIQNNGTVPNDTAPYLTGGVFTKDKKTFGFGRLEIKAKLNGAKGAWPAFWMLPKDAKWPAGGEIDIMERLSNDAYVYQTVHSSYTHTLGIKDNPVASIIASIRPYDYNVFALEKYPDSLVFFVNNTRTKTYPRIETTEEGQFPFSEQEFYLLLDMQLGGSWVGAVDPNTLPVEMQIDWVRFYEKKTP